MPRLLVIAGPNGSGKSTLANYLHSVGVDFGTHINPDEIAATLNLPPVSRAKQAQDISEFQRERCLADKIDFSFETVMSHPSKVEFMQRARDSGFHVTLYFVATSDVEINISRVENRVLLGGHDVPHDRIRARYWRTLHLLALAALVAHRTVIFDNSALVGYFAHSRLPNSKGGLRPVAEVVRHDEEIDVAVEADVPQWVSEFLLKPLAELETQAVRGGQQSLRLTFRQKDGSF